MGKRLLRLRMLALMGFGILGSLVGPLTRAEAIEPTAYPFRTGNAGFVNGVTWTGPASQTADYWQFFQASFDGGAQNLSSADYLAVQYRADVGAPGMTFGLLVNGDRFGTAGVADNTVNVYFMNEAGVVSDLGKIMYGAMWVPEGSQGALLLPLKQLNWQWNNSASTLASVPFFYMTTNSLHNWNWAMSIGEIGYFIGNPAEAGASYTPLLDLSEAAKPSSYYYDSNVMTSLTTITGYPLPVGDKAFNGGRAWSGPAAATGDAWETLFVNFKAKVDLTSAQAIAVQYRADVGAPGLTWGVENSFTRYSTMVDEKKVYFQDEGELDSYEVASVLYGAVNIAQGKVGMAILPIDSIVYQFGDAGNTLSGVDNFLLTTNTMYNFNFTVSIGAVGYLDNDGIYHPIEIDYFYNTPGTTMELIDVQDWQIADSTEYPFRLGEFEAYKNGKIWVAPATGAVEDDIQKLTITFDATADMSAASYVAIQFANTVGNPGLTYALKTATNTYSIAGVDDGEKVYWIKENGDIATAAVVQYSAATTSISAGALLIPMAALGGMADPERGSLAGVTALEVTTNRRYNYNFQAKFGEIGFYTGEIGEEGTTFTKVLDLTNDKSGQFTTSGSLTNESTLIVTNERTIYGDSIINVTGTGKSPSNFSIWTGGSYGSVTMVTDTYGDTAMQLKATGSNPTGDAYTAITIAAGATGWDGRKGVTFWARNDSDGEVSFNLEVDCRIVSSGVSDRFNIKQGHRFWLYDVNTELTSVYMTKPTATLPVGFEGWVRIPYSAFFRADWSNNGVTKEVFMSEGTTVSYLAITIHSSSYLNMPFSINKFGAYSTTPTWSSPFVTGTSIPELMDLVG
jgi:hypothetical protein